MSSDISERMQAGLEHHQSGRLQEAETIYRSVLTEQPGHPDALHLLGVIALQFGNSEAAVNLIENAIKANPKEPQFYNMCGEAYRVLRKYDVAITRFEQALAIQPDFVGAHINLGNTFKETGRLEDAAACYEKAIAISPDFAMSHNNLGVVLKDLGRPEEAVAHYEQAVAIMPDYAEAQTNLGNALIGLGRPEEAISHYNQALDIQPGIATAHYNLGIALDELSRPEEATVRYEQALAIDPDYAEAHHNLANALDELGRREDAISHYEQALAIKPGYAEAHRNLARINPEQEQAAAIEKLLENPSLSEIDATHCHFALGNIHHNAKNFDKAFEHYEHANKLKRKAVCYNSHSFTAYVNRLIDTFSESYFQEIFGSGSDSKLPVFIIGMPRSGTTLVEQIVSSHPRVHGAGELAFLGRFEQSIAQQFESPTTYPECMPLCYESVAPEFSRKYLEEIRNYEHDAERITDKMPDNFMRVGLIKTLFPKARIIHCQRNALDTCTSNFLNYFATGNEYSFDLSELGQYYLDYERLMAHWDNLFSSEILTVRYEELIMNQEGISRQMVEYLGLEWDDRCLEFHKNVRAVHNFSSMQVRQQIYAHSINRWKAYENQLAPLLEILPRASSDLPA